MSERNPHACTARTAPFPVHGGEYTSTGRDLMRVEPQQPAALDAPAEASADTAGGAKPIAAPSGNKKESRHG